MTCEKCGREASMHGYCGTCLIAQQVIDYWKLVLRERWGIEKT